MSSFWAAVNTDVTDLLPSINAPALVLHPERDVIAPIEWGHFVASRLPNAAFVSLDSDVNLICVSDVIEEMARHIAAFIDRLAP